VDSSKSALEAPDRPAQWRFKPVEVAGWSLAGAACSAGAWTGGFVLASRVLVAPITETIRGNVFDAALVWCLMGAGCGLVIGALSGLFLGTAGRTDRIIGLSLGGAVTGAIGGGLTPLVVFAGAGALSPLANSAIAWAIAGLLTGGVARIVVCPEPVRDDWDLEEARQELHSTTWRPKRGSKRRDLPDFVCCFPILAISGFALIAVGVLAWSSASLALLAVGLSGPFTALALVHQNRRIRELERLLRTRK
jgi:hypothetical protein